MPINPQLIAPTKTSAIEILWPTHMCFIIKETGEIKEELTDVSIPRRMGKRRRVVKGGRVDTRFYGREELTKERKRPMIGAHSGVV